MKVRPTIVIDTREQLPYSFNPDSVGTVRRGLDVGDYSLEGFEERVAVERKSLDDYVGSLIRGRARFLREITRMQNVPNRLVVVEGSLADVMGWNYRSGVHPNAVLGGTISLIVDHEIPVIFCSDRQLACGFTEEYLKRVYRKLTHENNTQNGESQSE